MKYTPHRGIEPRPPRWERGILTTGPMRIAEGMNNVSTGGGCARAGRMPSEEARVLISPTSHLVKFAISKRVSASGNRTPATAVKARDPNHWTNAEFKYRNGIALAKWLWFLKKMKNEMSPSVGLEPTTLRLRVSRSTDWANRAMFLCIRQVIWSPGIYYQ